MSRFTKHEVAEVAPGFDYVTRSTKGPFVDTGVTIKRETLVPGRLYLSVDTIRELAEVAGIIEPAKNENREAVIFSRGYLEAVNDKIGDDLGNILRTLEHHFGVTLRDGDDASDTRE